MLRQSVQQGADRHKLDFPHPQRSLPRRRLANLRHKLQLRLQGTVDWLPQFQHFTARWVQIQALRTLEFQLDVALLVSLWGWPRHRIALHRQLAAIAEQSYAIRSRLDYLKPEPTNLDMFPRLRPVTFSCRLGPPSSVTMSSCSRPPVSVFSLPAFTMADATS